MPAIKQLNELKVSLNKLLFGGADVSLLPDSKQSSKSDSGERLLVGGEVDSEGKTEGDDGDSVACEDKHPLVTFCSELDDIMH